MDTGITTAADQMTCHVKEAAVRRAKIQAMREIPLKIGKLSATECVGMMVAVERGYVQTFRQF